jgi:hypothetical protein
MWLTVSHFRFGAVLVLRERLTAPVREFVSLNPTLGGVLTAEGGRQWRPSTVRAVLIRSGLPNVGADE